MISMNLPDEFCLPAVLEYALVWVIITDAFVVACGIGFFVVAMNSFCEKDVPFSPEMPYIIND